jgi:Fe-S cluster assembly ATPase SufC
MPMDHFSLRIPVREIHMLMVKYCIGKRSLTKVIADNPDAPISNCKMIFTGENITQLPPEECA